MFVRHFHSRNCACFLIFLACFIGVTRVQADHITTIDGQSLEGIIREENKFYITIDVRGVLLPIPRERIKEITRASLDDNVKSLLDRALEARSRDDLGTARTLIEQARALNSRNAGLVDNLREQDQELTDLEKRGGTPEARRAKAAVYLAQANEAYDKVHITGPEGGNALLLQALRADPTYEEAQRHMMGLLANRKDVDAEMAAEYFAIAVWPDHVTPDNPVIPMLPEIFKELAIRFDQGTDITKSRRYVELMGIISEALKQQPQWLTKADPEAKAMLEKPLPQLLSGLIENNLRRGNAEFALQKLKGWADPTASPEMALMFVRAHVGTGDYDKAADILQKAVTAFPDDTTLQSHLNALKLMVTASTARKLGKNEEALTDYEKVFAARESLAGEIGESVGQKLADIKSEQLEAIKSGSPAPTGYLIANIAAQVLRYSSDRNHQRRAAEVLVAALPRVPWHLILEINVNGIPVNYDPTLKNKAELALSRPFNVGFDDQSPFTLNLKIEFSVIQTSATQAAQAVAGGAAGLAVPIAAPGLGFTVTASHPSLGPLISQHWQEQALPPDVKARREAAGASTPEGQPVVFGALQNPNSLVIFVESDLADYLGPRFGLLNSKLQVPKIQELLGPEPLR